MNKALVKSVPNVARSINYLSSIVVHVAIKYDRLLIRVVRVP